MKVALAQNNYTVGAIKSNKVKIINSIYKAKQEGADLVVFSEYAISGMFCYDLLTRPQFLESCEVALVEIASHCDDISVLVGLPVQDGREQETISVGAFIQNRRIIKYIGKKTISFREEKAYITPSKGCETIIVAGEKVDVVLGSDCMDTSEYSPMSSTIVCLCSDPFSTDVMKRRSEFIRNLTFVSGKHFVGVNHLGGQSDTVFDGYSAAVNKLGNPIALLKGYEEDFGVVDLENASELEYPEYPTTENYYKAIKLGLKDYFSKSGMSKACVGLSGGIDSAVVLAFAVEVLGAENVHALLMPSKFSSDHSVNDSVQMAENLGIKYDIIPINDLYEQALTSLRPILRGTGFDTTEENIQSRLRCMLLMALSNKHNSLLLNTSNKSEIAMGYGTLYGDMAGSIGIIADLYKTEVYALARYINRDEEIIPDNIITKEPSAELNYDQRDTDSLPPYDVLDPVLYRLIEKRETLYQIIDAGYDEEVVKRVVNNINFTVHKRRQACPALRMSIRPFGVGLVLPIVNKYKFQH